MGVKMTEFKELPNNRGQVSRCGRFISVRGVELLGTVRHGYRLVMSGGRQKGLHRLVAEAFVPNPESKPEVNHIDGNKLNNHASNLEWVTRTENMRHAVNANLHKLPSGEGARAAKLTQVDVDYIRDTYRPRTKGQTLRDLGDQFGVTEQCIHRIVTGKTWPTVSP
jgi:hypothetical protein